ncbi:hypothetical protein DITRI_Ditri11bG0059400 [Diplodiscus trichospermus]
MAQEHNFFALLGDLDDDNVSNLIDGVKQEDDKKKSSRVEKVQMQKKDEQKIAQQISTDMWAKRLVLPSHGNYVRNIPIVNVVFLLMSACIFLVPEERENAEAEARRKAKEENKANDSVESSGGKLGDSDPFVAADDKSRKQPVRGNFASSDNSMGGQSTTLNKCRGGHRDGNGYHRKNGGHYSYQRNNRGANVYQQNNGYSEGNCTSAKGYQPWNSGQYQGGYKGSNGNQRYNGKYNGVSTGEQFNEGGYPSGNVADDGWQYVGRGRCDNRGGTYQENSTHEQDVIKYESLGESKHSQKDSEKSVNRNNDVDISTENKHLAGQQAIENEVEGHLPMTTEGQEDSQSEKKSGEGMDDAKSRKKSKKKKKKKNNKKKDQDSFDEKKDEKKEKDMRNLMTLKEYEKKLEDRKNLEAFKRPEQRKVEDKDFESMQIVGKEKEDSQLKSEEKLKKKGNIKEEKVRKTLSINEFLEPVKVMWQRRYGYRPYGRRDIERADADSKGKGERYNTRLDGRMSRSQGDGDRADGKGYGERPCGRLEEGRTASEGPVPSSPPAPPPRPSFDFEQHQFPALRGNGKA